MDESAVGGLGGWRARKRQPAKRRGLERAAFLTAVGRVQVCWVRVYVSWSCRSHDLGFGFRV